MPDDRTWLASVLFLDIVNYSMKPVNEQLVIKRHFQDLVSHYLSSLTQEDLICLDTGDGLAACYLGDPEPMFQVARQLRDAFVALASGPTPYEVRLGLNLGPVKIVEDLHHERNCVGSGINDAQRVMSFAAPNQLLVSRSYFDMVSQLSQDYSHELRHLGVLADKHNLEHDVYELAVEVVKVGAGAPAAESGAGASGAPDAGLDPAALDRIRQEYASYVGSSNAEQVIAELLPATASIADLCAQLSARMESADDRYSFNEFLRYYGYGGY